MAQPGPKEMTSTQEATHRATVASKQATIEAKEAAKEAREAARTAREAASRYEVEASKYETARQRAALERLEKDQKAEYYFRCTTHDPPHIATKEEIDAKKYPQCKKWTYLN